MVRGDRASVFHGSPIRPFGNFVTNLPDLLTPDNVFEVQHLLIFHHPLSNISTRFGPNLERCQTLTETSFNGFCIITDELTPPADEHIISVAMPQQ